MNTIEVLQIDLQLRARVVRDARANRDEAVRLRMPGDICDEAERLLAEAIEEERFTRELLRDELAARSGNFAAWKSAIAAADALRGEAS